MMHLTRSHAFRQFVTATSGRISPTKFMKHCNIYRRPYLHWYGSFECLEVTKSLLLSWRRCKSPGNRLCQAASRESGIAVSLKSYSRGNETPGRKDILGSRGKLLMELIPSDQQRLEGQAWTFDSKSHVG
jgi:hypothetical protein